MKEIRNMFLTVVFALLFVVTTGLSLRLRSIEREKNASMRKPPEKKNYKIVEMEVTAYCRCKICCEECADGVTSIGRDAKTKGIAADPKFIPYGTVLEVPGYGKFEVDDTGRDMRKAAKLGKYHIDVRFPTHKEALEWGRRKKVKVKIYEPSPAK